MQYSTTLDKPKEIAYRIIKLNKNQTYNYEYRRFNTIKLYNLFILLKFFKSYWIVLLIVAEHSSSSNLSLYIELIVLNIPYVWLLLCSTIYIIYCILLHYIVLNLPYTKCSVLNRFVVFWYCLVLWSSAVPIFVFVLMV